MEKVRIELARAKSEKDEAENSLSNVTIVTVIVGEELPVTTKKSNFLTPYCRPPQRSKHI